MEFNDLVSRFEKMDALDLVELSAEERLEQKMYGEVLLRRLMKNVKESPDAAIATAEKMLFLASSRAERKSVAEDLIVAASKKGLTKVTPSTGKRNLEAYFGPFFKKVDNIRSRSNSLPDLGSRSGRRWWRLGLLVALVIIALVLFHPAVSGLFTAENARGLLVGVGALLVIAVFFLSGGFLLAGITLVVVALLYAGIQAIMPLELFVKLAVLAIAAAAGVWCFVRARRESRKLSAENRRRYDEQLAALRKDADRLRRYGETLVEQINQLLRGGDDSNTLAALAAQSRENADEESRDHWENIWDYIGQYRDYVERYLRYMKSDLPD